MRFIKTPLKDAYLIEPSPIEDHRGFFARIFCDKTFQEVGLNPTVVQINNSFNKHRATLRGLHYQLPPMQEDKLIRCIKGSLYDVILDLRPHSESFGCWFGHTLTEKNKKMMYVPKGFAHGFITLEDNTEALYCVSQYYSPEHERGIRWDDPKFNIHWPISPCNLSERDQNHPFFNPKYHLQLSGVQ